MMMKKTAIVTGGSRGIGFAIAKRLGQDGFNIAIIDMNVPEGYKENFDVLTALGTDYLYVRGNICKAEDREKLLRETISKFGGIHVLVNNAGVAPKVRVDLLEMTEESFDRVVGINTKGNMFMTQAVAKQMIKQPLEKGKKRGTIVNISSCSATVSSIGRGEYCVSKAGVSMLTTLYADRLASEGILVNEVRPGVIATDMTATVQEKYNKMFQDGIFPIARWGTAADIASAVSVLAGDDFLYTTGDHINVDGGFHIQRL
jgi:3-oxoacyl-[acyl-carrier protein] reductase